MSNLEITLISLISVFAILFAIFLRKTTHVAKRINIKIELENQDQFAYVWDTIVTFLANQKSICLDAEFLYHFSDWEKNNYSPKIIATVGKGKIKANELFLEGKIVQGKGEFQIKGYLRYFSNEELNPVFEKVLDVAGIPIK